MKAIPLLARADAALTAPAPTGRLLDAHEIAAELYHGKVKARWVLAHFAPASKFYAGRQAVWWERDARAWLADEVERQRARRRLTLRED